MHKEYKIWNCKLKFWLTCFSIFTIVLITFIPITLVEGEWLHSNFLSSVSIPDKNPLSPPLVFSGESFKSSIDTCISGCSKKVSYSTISQSYCDLDLQSKKRTPISNSTKSICSLFNDLERSSHYKLLFDIFAEIFLSLWLISIIILFKRLSFLKCSIFLCLCGCLFYCIGTISWFSTTSFNLSNCSDFPVNGDKPDICVSINSIFSFILLIIIPIISAIFASISIKLSQIKKNASAVGTIQNRADGVVVVRAPQRYNVNIDKNIFYHIPNQNDIQTIRDNPGSYLYGESAVIEKPEDQDLPPAVNSFIPVQNFDSSPEDEELHPLNRKSIDIVRTGDSK